MRTHPQSQEAGPVLVTGGAGFVGSAVVRELLSRGIPVRALMHRTRLPRDLEHRVERVPGDLADPSTLRGIARATRGVIHAAVHVSDDPLLCGRVNGDGTRALVEQAARAGAGRIVALSNCAVYGWAVHPGAKESGCTVAPATPVSCSRVVAERALVEAGATVFRPLFVYGQGDTRFIPSILAAMHRLPFIVDGGRARVSVIGVDDLANALVTAVLTSRHVDLSGAFHINDGQPVTFREIHRTLERLFDLRAPTISIPYWLARVIVQARSAGSRSVSGSASGLHRLFLVSRDHWYDASTLAQRLTLPAYRSLPDRLHEAHDWYERFVSRA